MLLEDEGDFFRMICVASGVREIVFDLRVTVFLVRWLVLFTVVFGHCDEVCVNKSVRKIFGRSIT